LTLCLPPCIGFSPAHIIRTARITHPPRLLCTRFITRPPPLQVPSSGLSTQTIAIIAGCSCGGVLLIAAAAYMIRRRRLSQQHSTVEPPPASAPAMEMTRVRELPAEAWKQQPQQQQQQQLGQASHSPQVLQQA